MIDEHTKLFVVPTGWMQRRLRHLMAAVGGLNHRKIGRTRRGNMMLAGIGATPMEGVDATLVAVTIRRPDKPRAIVSSPKGVRVVRFCPYPHRNVSKVLKELAVAHAKRERHEDFFR